MTKLLDDTQFFAIQLEQLLFGKYVARIPVHLFTDSRPLLDSISSIHQVEEKLLRNSITDFKDVLYDGKVASFHWIPGSGFLADGLTKPCKWSVDMEDVMLRNTFRNVLLEFNVVRCSEGEIRMHNLTTKEIRNE